jgi:hypothetical protein
MPKTLLALVVVLAATTAGAQPADRNTAFIESLRREDPESAARFIALHDAQAAAAAELDGAQRRYNAAGAELRAVSLPALVQARRRYAETSLALMDFLDARDRRTIARLRSGVDDLTRGLEERARTRAELERMLRGD